MCVADIMGNWFDHVADYWDNHRTDPNILCVRYEDVKQVRNIATKIVIMHPVSFCFIEFVQFQGTTTLYRLWFMLLSF